MESKKLLITPGEPAGIGPEIVVKLATKEQPFTPIAVCDPSLLTRAAEALKINLRVKVVTSVNEAVQTDTGTLHCLPVPLNTTASAGVLDVTNARYVLNTLDLAAQLCLDRQADAMVTGPVQKSIINEAGIAFSGHTEYLAELSNTPRVVMMLANRNLRVALVTTHIPLAQVSAAITPQLIHEVTSILHDDLQSKFGIINPHILVCGLNPHAGEGGHLGMEEIETITPALNRLRDSGLTISGPLPADTLFGSELAKSADAILAMYHDQGLPVLKSQGFGESVNITLGLPFIRTSVDHGTALNLAGKGEASETSLQAACEMANTLAIARQ